MALAKPDHRVSKPPSTTPQTPKPPPEEPPRPKIKLGIAKSDADTMTWLGYEKPTEHLAPRGKVEQSALSMAAPGPRAPRPSQAAPPAPAPSAPDAAVREQVQRGAKAVAGAFAAARQRIADVAEELKRRETAGSPATRVTEAPKPAASPQAKPTPPPAQASAAGGGGGTPGAPSNKESSPVSVKDAPTVKPGQVVAARGLEIRTVEPRWSTTTLMTRRPRNPTVLITFWRDGTVKEVQWAREGENVYDAGSPEVNQPLLEALYAWTASGKPLQDLDPKDPGACLTIMMTVLLVG